MQRFQTVCLTWAPDPSSRSSCLVCSCADPTVGTQPCCPPAWTPPSPCCSTWWTWGSSPCPGGAWAGTPRGRSSFLPWTSACRAPRLDRFSVTAFSSWDVSGSSGRRRMTLGCKTCLQSLVSRSGSVGGWFQVGGMGRGREWMGGFPHSIGGRSRRLHGCTQTWTASGRLLNSTGCRGSDGGVAGRKGRSVRRGRIGVMQRASRDAGLTGWRGGRSGSWIPRPRSGTKRRGRHHWHRSPPGLEEGSRQLETKDGFGEQLLGRCHLRLGLGQKLRLRRWVKNGPALISHCCLPSSRLPCCIPSARYPTATDQTNVKTTNKN